MLQSVPQTASYPREPLQFPDEHLGEAKLTGTDPVTGKQTYGVQLDSMDNANNSFFSYQMIASAYDAKVFQYGKTVEDSTVNFENDKTEKVFQMIQDLGKYTSSNVKEGMNRQGYWEPDRNQLPTARTPGLSP